MDLNDTLFKSLLLQNNITEFRKFRIDPKSIDNSKLDNSIKIDYKYFNIDNIYAYIKNDIFHICNEKFEEIKLSNLYFAEKGLHLIGYNDEQFFYPYLNQEHSLVISSGGDIICRDPKDFFYVGTNEFLENPPIFLNDYEEGLLYDFLKRQFINPITYDGWEGYKRNFNVPVPKI